MLNNWSKFKIKTQEVADKLGVEVDPLALITGGVPNLLPSSNILIKEGDYINLVVKTDFDWEVFEKALANNEPT